MSIGPFSALVLFFNEEEKLIFNLVSKYIYNKVMPSICNRLLIEKPKIDEWLDWGEGQVGTQIKVQRGLNTEIDGRVGTFFGEWVSIGSNLTPKGRGALYCEDKFILGYTDSGRWADNTPMIIFEKD